MGDMIRIHVKDDPSGYRLVPILGNTVIADLVVTAFQGDLGDDKRAFFVVTHRPSGCHVGHYGFDSIHEAQHAVMEVQALAPHIDWSKRQNSKQAAEAKSAWGTAVAAAGGYLLEEAPRG